MTDQPAARTGKGIRQRAADIALYIVLGTALIVAGTAFYGLGRDLIAPGGLFGPSDRTELAAETKRLRAEVRQLSHEVLQARTDLRALEQEVAAVLARPETDWDTFTQRTRALARDCPAADVLPAAPQRQADTAYRTRATVRHHQHPIFNFAESWPMTVDLPDGSRLLLRVVPEALDRLPDWQAGRTVELCFGWPNDADQPLLLGDF